MKAPKADATPGVFETAEQDAVQFNRPKVTAVFEDPPEYDRCPTKTLLPPAENGGGGVAELLGSFFRRSQPDDECQQPSKKKKARPKGPQLNPNKRFQLVPCLSRMPVVGDIVRRLDGKISTD